MTTTHPDSARPRRSVLYMPGSNARALDKGRSLPTDGIILDLEDAVAPDAKESARAQVLGALETGGYGMRELILRVNGLSTAWGHDDLVAAARWRARRAVTQGGERGGRPARRGRPRGGRRAG